MVHIATKPLVERKEASKVDAISFKLIELRVKIFSSALGVESKKDSRMALKAIYILDSTRSNINEIFPPLYAVIIGHTIWSDKFVFVANKQSFPQIVHE